MAHWGTARSALSRILQWRRHFKACNSDAERTYRKRWQILSFSTLDKPDEITAKSVALAAREGDELALRVYKTCGEKLGQGLAILIDILNPEVIIIGSVFERSGDLMIDSVKKTLKKEALGYSLECCKILPAMLGDSIGDYAALGVAFA